MSETEIKEPNPFIEPENYFKGYQKSLEELSNNPELYELDRLCYELFHLNEQGKKFMELINDRFLIPSLAARGTTYQIDVLWQEGFKDFIRMLLNGIKTHKQRLSIGKN